MRRFNVWVNSINTTSFRIITSVIVTAIGMLGLLIALLFFKWEPTALQLKLLEGEAVVALTMMGFDVIQYIGKRFSDKDYATARASVALPAVNVTAESPAVVQVVRPAAASVGAPPSVATVAPSAVPATSEKGL